MSHTKFDRAETNRNNARYSTGPQTFEGKRRSALNALRHGLTGQTVVMPSEDLEAYQHHIQRFVDEYHPHGATETQLVQSLADAAWRLNRVSALETNLLTRDIIYDDFPNHESTHEMREAIAIAAALDSHTRALSTLSLHGQRLSRQFEKTLALLEQLQSTRLVRQECQVNAAVNSVQKHSRRPQRSGFVFSKSKPPSPSDSGFTPRVGLSLSNKTPIVMEGSTPTISPRQATGDPDDVSRPLDVN